MQTMRILTTTILAFTVAIVLQGCGSNSGSNSDPVVNVANLGSVRGIIVNQTIHSFRGIPYGKAPVGSLRWQPPVAHGGWSDERDASQFGHACISHYPNQYFIVNESEDCLVLNIAKPADAKNLPVMVFIHGGAYCSGDASGIPAESMVLQSKQAVVVVTINYRLNVFGFLGSTSLKERSSSKSTGNHGIEDQRLALEWVRDHIGSFGGDGSDVTIFGESAGGNSILVHLVQKLSNGLFSKGIAESGGYVAAIPLANADQTYHKVLNALNCTDSNCLEKVPVETIRAHIIDDWHFPQDIWAPVVDGVAMTDYPQKLISEGNYNNKVPIMIGSNSDEFALPVSMVPKNLTQQNYEQWGAWSRWNVSTATVERLALAQTPLNTGGFSKWWWAWQRRWTLLNNNNNQDQMSMGLGHCSVRCLARSFVRGGSPKVFSYVFAHGPQKQFDDMNEGYPVPHVGRGNVLAPHTSELPYVFGMVDMLGEEYGEADLARTITSYWSTFAKNGDPNHYDKPMWPKYDGKTDASIMFGQQVSTEISIVSGYANDMCDFSDQQKNSVCKSESVMNIIV